MRHLPARRGRGRRRSLTSAGATAAFSLDALQQALPSDASDEEKDAVRTLRAAAQARRAQAEQSAAAAAAAAASAEAPMQVDPSDAQRILEAMGVPKTEHKRAMDMLQEAATKRRKQTSAASAAE